MLSHKEKSFGTQTLTPEDLVPTNHFYRALEATPNMARLKISSG
jgi:hypothetical protein